MPDVALLPVSQSSGKRAKSSDPGNGNITIIPTKAVATHTANRATTIAPQAIIGIMLFHTSLKLVAMAVKASTRRPSIIGIAKTLIENANAANNPPTADPHDK